MKSIVKQFLFLAGFLVFSGVFAQTYSGDATVTSQAAYELQNSGNTTTKSVNRALRGENSVFINQIGDYNNVQVNASAKELDIEVVQNGDGNSVYLNSKAGKIEQKIFQQGDNHNIVDFSYSSNVHNLELIQSGNSQNLILYGENSISEKMKIKMDGDSQSLVIRNFN